MQRTIDTPIGAMTLTEEAGALTHLGWHRGPAGEEPQGDSALLTEAARQLAAYFDGRLTNFDLPWRVTASVGQARICAALAAIPFGDTRTYGEIAKELGVPAQVVGQGCGANPLAVIVPCHRVLAANGLGGFSASGGVETKVWLLRHEGAAGLLI